jgi:tetratricopeptide (TPR) repeat protein
LSFFNELKRRNVFRIAIAYVVVAWLVAQVLQLNSGLRPIAEGLALRLEPANTSIIRQAAGLATLLGRLDGALALVQILTSRDPVNPRIHFNFGLYYMSAGQWDKAIASYRTVLALSPGYGGGQYYIGVALMLKGEPQAALEAMQLDTSILGQVGLPMAYHALGWKEESDAALVELIAEQEQFAACNIAYVLAYRGEADRAFEWLAKAVGMGDSQALLETTGVEYPPLAIG